MLGPDIVSELFDRSHNIRFRFLGYRKLTMQEMVEGAMLYLRQPRVRRRKKAKRTQVVAVLSIHGATDPIQRFAK